MLQQNVYLIAYSKFTRKNPADFYSGHSLFVKLSSSTTQLNIHVALALIRKQ